MRVLFGLMGGLVGLLLVGCSADLPTDGTTPLDSGSSEPQSTDSAVQAQAQMNAALETMGIPALHRQGLSGDGVSILLMAPFEGHRTGAHVSPGFFAKQLVTRIAPKAQLLECETGGDTFSVDRVQFSDCLLDALSQEPDVVIAGATSWSTHSAPCEDRLDGRVAESDLLMFAGAGDSHKDGLAYPACVKGVEPVLATYGATESGDLPFIRSCWQGSVRKDEPTCFSNFLADQSLLAAPGAIIELDEFNVDLPYCCSTALAATMLGTSTALVKEAFPGLSRERIFRAFQQTAVPVFDAKDRRIGLRVSADRAYRKLNEEQERQSEQSSGEEESETSLASFDRNDNCRIDEPEFTEALDAWSAGKIDNALFMEVLDAWTNQADVCRENADSSG